MFDFGKKDIPHIHQEFFLATLANSFEHICVCMVDSAETTLVIYRKHYNAGYIYRNVCGTCSYF